MLVIPRFSPRSSKRRLANAPVRMAATGHIITGDAVGSVTTGTPPSVISQLSNNFNGWLTWMRTLHPCGVFDNWRDAGGQFPTGWLLTSWTSVTITDDFIDGSGNRRLRISVTCDNSAGGTTLFPSARSPNYAALNTQIWEAAFTGRIISATHTVNVKVEEVNASNSFLASSATVITTTEQVHKVTRTFNNVSTAFARFAIGPDVPAGQVFTGSFEISLPTLKQTTGANQLNTNMVGTIKGVINPALPLNTLDQRMISQTGDTPPTQSAWARLFYGGMQARGTQAIEVATRNSDLLIALSPQLAIIGVGEDNIITDTAAALHTKLQTLIDGVLTNTTAYVLIMCPFTRVNAAGGLVIGNSTDDAIRQKIIDVANLIKTTYSANARVRIIDPNPIHTGSNALATPLPFRTMDTLSLSPRGAYYIGKEAANVLKAWGFPDFSATLYPVPSAYNSSTNPQGNVFLNAAFTGTGGTKGAGVTSGTMPDSCELIRTAGDATAIVSNETGSDGTPKLVMTFTPGTSISTFELDLDQTTAGTSELPNPFAASTWIRAHLFAECSSYSDWRLIRLRVRPSNDGFDLFAGNNLTYGASRPLYPNETSASGLGVIQNQFAHMPDEAWSGYLETPPYQIRSSGGTIRYRLQIIIGVSAGSPIFKISKPVLRAITDPRISYGAA